MIYLVLNKFSMVNFGFQQIILIFLSSIYFYFSFLVFLDGFLTILIGVNA